MNRTIFALGFFDGVHLGHRALLEQCQRLARENGVGTGAVTFTSHPDALVLGHAPDLINSEADRDRLLLRFVDSVKSLPFDREMQATPWDRFLDMLVEQGAAGFVCGDDFRFGAFGAGNGRMLRQYCRQQGLPCAVVPEQTVDGIRVSSTHIRQLLQEGDMEHAARFLGHPHILTAPVIHGRRLGRTLGTPTANQLLPPGLTVPRFGVYGTRVDIDGVIHPAVTNIGTRPTVDGQGITVESWILDYSGDLYDRVLTLEFLRFLRPERKFDTLEELQAEIQKDADTCRLPPPGARGGNACSR